MTLKSKQSYHLVKDLLIERNVFFLCVKLYDCQRSFAADYLRLCLRQKRPYIFWFQWLNFVSVLSKGLKKYEIRKAVGINSEGNPDIYLINSNIYLRDIFLFLGHCT